MEPSPCGFSLDTLLRKKIEKRRREQKLIVVSDWRPSKPKTKEELPMTVVVPAYVISELKTGFQMGFFLFVPFLLIDLVVSTTLLSMGMPRYWRAT